MEVAELKNIVKEFVSRHSDYQLAASVKFHSDYNESGESAFEVFVYKMEDDRARKVGRYLIPVYASLLEKGKRYLLELMERSDSAKLDEILEKSSRTKKTRAKPAGERKTLKRPFRLSHGKEILAFVESLPNPKRYTIETHWHLDPAGDFIFVRIFDADYSKQWAKWTFNVRILDSYTLTDAKKAVVDVFKKETGWRL